MTDTPDSDEGETAMRRFEDFARKVFSKTKDDLEKAEGGAGEIDDEAIGPPPAKGPALSDEAE